MSKRWLSLDDAQIRALEVTPTEFVTWHSWFARRRFEKGNC